MFARIIGFSIRNPLIIGLGVLALIIWGVVSFQELPIDAVPDITNNQVQVVTLTPALAPQEVERLITIPVEQTMATIAGIVERRSISRFGLSVVTLVFEDNVDVYWARSQVDQRLTEASEVIPPGAGTPVMMPITTGLGEIFQYRLEVGKGLEQRYDVMELRTIHDWMVRRRLLGTEGVADVASFGGFLRQIEIAVTPERLRAFGLSVADVLEHVERNNGNSGGAYVERGPNVAYIRTEGIATTLEDVSSIIIGQTEGGLPILVKDVATVRNGSAVRYGALTHNDEGESVGGIVYMLKGANSNQVIQNVKQRIAEIERTLPEGITVAPYLDRSDLVNRTIQTVATNLVEGALIVIFVLVLMLGNARAGFIVASVIPLSMLFAIGMMRMFGVSGNLMSLGAIDFGLIVDGAVIIVEHVLHRLQRFARDPASSRALARDLIEHAALEIRRSAAFGEFIILIVYVPILTLVGIEGKMFKPMAQTVMFAILGAFLLSTTYVPMMSALLLKNVRHDKVTFADRIMRFLHRMYLPVRRFALRKPAPLFGLAVIGLIGAVVAFLNMGAEFIPSLSEGDFAVETRLQTGSSLSETVEVTQQAARILLDQFPEVKECVGKVGTTEIPLDPMPIEACDLMVILKPRSEWTSASNREELANKMQEALEAVPGVEFGFQQPIQMRFNELMTGARQDVVIKVFGEDLQTLVRLSQEIGAIAASVQGAADIFEEPVDGLPQVVVRIDRRRAALLGVNVADINTTVRAAFAGEAAGSLYEQERRFDIVVRLNPTDRANIRTLERLTVPTHDGRLVPLPQVADIMLVQGPNQIQREEGRRRIYVGLNVRDRDVQSLVDEIHTRIEREVDVPPGYEITYGGQFENLQAASSRLMIAVPAALLLILFLLYLTFGQITETLLVFTAIPLSAIGGVVALLLRGLPFSISAGVGFIALFGVAVLNGIVLMAAFIKHADQGPLRTVLRGTNDRLRPVTMTALVASLGFLPMALSVSDGAEVQRPLATVVIGGLISSTMLTLVVLPALYFVVKKRMNKNSPRRTVPASTLLLLVLLVGSTAPAFGQDPTAMSRSEIRVLISQRNIAIEQAATRTQQADVMKGAAVDLGPTRVMWTGGQYNADEFDQSIAIEQSLPFPTRMAASVSLASAEVDHARAREALTRRSVMARAEQAFDRIAYAREMLRLLNRLDSVLLRAVTASERGQQAGSVPSVTVLTAQSQLSEVRVRKLTVNTQLQSAETELRVLCRDSSVTTTDSVLPRREPPATERLSPVITNEAQQRINVAEERSDYASSAWWPNINLMYTNQTMVGVPLVNGGLATSTDRFQFFGVGLDLPLWFGPTSARAQEADLERTITAASARADLDATARRKEQLERELRTLERTMDHYDGPSAEQVRTLVDHAERSYEAGEIGWAQYQQAIETAINIRVNRLDALLRHNDVVITLEQLTKD